MESRLIYFFHLLQDPHNRTRGHTRDGKCLITGMQTQTYSRLKVAHIFPQAHDVEVSDLYLSHTYWTYTNTAAVDTQRLPKQYHRHCR